LEAQPVSDGKGRHHVALRLGIKVLVQILMVTGSYR
jgi:hypothetical protein